MFNPNNLFTAIFTIPILNLLVGLYKVFLTLGIPGALGFSLVFLTVIIRLALYPLTASQLKNAYKLNKLKPQLDKLTMKYKNDKARLHQEQLRLYKEVGINPAAGCLPLLLQMPILIALYNLFFQILAGSNLDQIVEGINKVVYFPFLKIATLNLSFFGLNLAYKPAEWQKYGYWLLAVPVITGLLQHWQTKAMTPTLGTPTTPPQVTTTQEKFNTKKAKDDKKEEEDMGTAMQKQMAIMMPIMIGLFAYSFPLGLSLYWNTFTIFGIIQQYQLNRQLDKEDGKNKTRR